MERQKGDRFKIVGTAAEGWRCHLRQSGSCVTVEVECWAPHQIEVLGEVVFSEAGATLGQFKGKNALEVGRQAWVEWATARGIKSVSVNRFPGNPESIDLTSASEST
jgi:hypothetical protein